MFKAIIYELLYLLVGFESEKEDEIELSKKQWTVVSIVTYIITFAIIFVLVYFGLKAIAFSNSTIGTILVILAFLFAFSALLKIVRIRR